MRSRSGDGRRPGTGPERERITSSLYMDSRATGGVARTPVQSSGPDRHRRPALQHSGRGRLARTSTRAGRLTGAVVTKQ